jgi:hypothetical protein
MLHAVPDVSGGGLCADVRLLIRLSLMPFTSPCTGGTFISPLPVKAPRDQSDASFSLSAGLARGGGRHPAPGLPVCPQGQV